MLDLNSQPLSPSFACGEKGAKVLSKGAYRLSENADLALASVSVRKNGVRPAPFGLTLPDVADLVQTPDYGAFWIGPEAWMIEGYKAAHRDFAAEVKAQSPECSVTEQTDGFVCFEITSTAGAVSIDVLLEKLVNIDPRTLKAVRTTFEHMSVFVLRRGPNAIAVLGMRSAAQSLWHTLSAAITRQSKEFL